MEGVIHFEIWEVLFRDMGGADLRYGRCGNVFWEAGTIYMSSLWNVWPEFDSRILQFLLDLQYVRETRNIPRYALRRKGGGKWSCCR